MIIIGLTGSIGMGKSTTAAMFEEVGIPVWDADQTVHELYRDGGAGAVAISKFAPDVVDGNGVNRDRLRAAIMADATLLKQVEAAIHPLVGQHRANFLADARAKDRDIVVCDVPLLFETGGHAGVDKVVVVSAPADVQRSRVLERPGMTEDAFKAILAKQVPDAEKRALADYVIDTGSGMERARVQVIDIISDIRSQG